jgi:hypothetical protein
MVISWNTYQTWERHFFHWVSVTLRHTKIKAGLTRELHGPTAAEKSPHTVYAFVKSHGMRESFAAVYQPIGSMHF